MVPGAQAHASILVSTYVLMEYTDDSLLEGQGDYRLLGMGLDVPSSDLQHLHRLIVQVLQCSSGLMTSWLRM